jgi:hypothetical protein
MSGRYPLPKWMLAFRELEPRGGNRSLLVMNVVIHEKLYYKNKKIFYQRRPESCSSYRPSRVAFLSWMSGRYPLPKWVLAFRELEPRGGNWSLLVMYVVIHEKLYHQE